MPGRALPAHLLAPPFLGLSDPEEEEEESESEPESEEEDSSSEEEVTSSSLSSSLSEPFPQNLDACGVAASELRQGNPTALGRPRREQPINQHRVAAAIRRAQRPARTMVLPFQ